MNNMPRDNDTDSDKEKRRRGEPGDSFPSPKKRMFSIRDVPNLAMAEGKEMIAIPNGLNKEVTQILQQRKKDVRDQKINAGNVQILERMVGGCKKQMITLTEDGMRKMQKCGDQAECGKAGTKRQVSPQRLFWERHMSK